MLTVLWGGMASMHAVDIANAAEQGSCRQEIHQLCAEAAEGPARKQCIEQNFAKLSPTCQEKMRAHWQRQQQKKAASEAGAGQE